MGEMKVAGHTPGPWRYERGNGSPTTGEHMIAGAKPGYLAEVRDCGSGDVGANARLIAAAPELLAALELARRWMCEVPVAKRAGNFNIALDRVDAAIAKAEGR